MYFGGLNQSNLRGRQHGRSPSPPPARSERCERGFGELTPPSILPCSSSTSLGCVLLRSPSTSSHPSLLRFHFNRWSSSSFTLPRGNIWLKKSRWRMVKVGLLETFLAILTMIGNWRSQFPCNTGCLYQFCCCYQSFSFSFYIFAHQISDMTNSLHVQSFIGIYLLLHFTNLTYFDSLPSH